MVTDYVRPEDKLSWFSPFDNPANSQLFTLDCLAIAAAVGAGRVEPFALVEVGPMQPETFPIPAQHLPRLPTNHLSCVITWYGPAIALIAINSLDS